MVGLCLGLASLVAIALLTGVSLFGGLRSGAIHSKRMAYSRVSDPRSFWFYAAGYSVGFLSSAGLLVYFAIEALSPFSR